MMANSSIENRQCVAWRTDRPFVKRLRFSPDFAYQNSYWHLCLGFTEENEYYIQLGRKSTRNRFKSFDVTVYIESIAEKKMFFPRTVTISQTPQRIWNTPESVVLGKIPSLQQCGEFSVICVFHQFCGVMSFSKREETTKQVSTKNPNDFSLICQPGLENLSIDFCKLFENETFPDVKLRCEDRTFSAHRAVLAARSEVFAAMFRNKMVESETGTVDITDMKAPVLDLFLKYIYSGKILDLSEDTIPSLYTASDKYALHVLKKTCSERMVRDLKEENCLDFLIIADTHDDPSFKQQIISFISNNSKVLQSDNWFKFSEEVPNLTIEVYHKCFADQALKSDQKNTNIAVASVPFQTAGVRAVNETPKKDQPKVSSKSEWTPSFGPGAEWTPSFGHGAEWTPSYSNGHLHTK